ncbi:hypothetical protein Micbo1qcDRAFT_196384 [Microdochium bolleyi]|uniref:Uncharacterized protein n=1 Tax=Microdochium bolleyi TaxID=196109 RepID=A0A136IZM1_9PEZI|nr:hypothetical protein Micbo1qcDRAFT_196384 [Microdochium bolleyi]
MAHCEWIEAGARAGTGVHGSHGCWIAQRLCVGGRASVGNRSHNRQNGKFGSWLKAGLLGSACKHGAGPNNGNFRDEPHSATDLYLETAPTEELQMEGWAESRNDDWRPDDFAESSPDLGGTLLDAPERLRIVGIAYEECRARRSAAQGWSRPGPAVCAP